MESESLSTWRRILSLMGVLTWVAVVGYAWEGSSLSGGDVRERALRIADDVTVASSLNSPCRKLALNLAAAALKAKIGAFGPIADALAKSEAEAADRYFDMFCPVRAIPVIVHAVNEEFLDHEERRSMGVL